MEDTIQALTLLLTKSFPGAGIEIEESVPGTKIGGAVIVPQFVGVEQIERQHQLWAALRKNLTAEQLSRIGTILTFNPYEVEIMEEVLA